MDIATLIVTVFCRIDDPLEQLAAGSAAPTGELLPCDRNYPAPALAAELVPRGVELLAPFAGRAVTPSRPAARR